MSTNYGNNSEIRIKLFNYLPGVKMYHTNLDILFRLKFICIFLDARCNKGEKACAKVHYFMEHGEFHFCFYNVLGNRIKCHPNHY